MARYRKIDCRIWNDAKFRSLSDHGKLVFLMLLTHPGMTALGAMRATISGLAEELGWSTEAFREAFLEASSKGMVEHDPEASLIALPNFVKYNAPESPNVVRAWVGAIDLLPECALKTRVVASARGFVQGMTEGYRKAFAEAFAKAMPNQEQEQEQEQEKDLLSGKPDDAAQSDALHAGPKAQCVELLEYLNTRAGKRFRPVEANVRLLAARLKESTPDEIRAVIDAKAAEWGADAKMAKYLRPETLFNATKFAGYVGELGAAPARTNGAAWWGRAGFSSEGEAVEAGCQSWCWRQFRDGQRIPEQAA